MSSHRQGLPNTVLYTSEHIISITSFTPSPTSPRLPFIGVLDHRRPEPKGATETIFFNFFFNIFTGPGRGSGQPQEQGSAVAEVLPVVPQLLPSAHLHKRLIYELPSKSPHFTEEKPQWGGEGVWATQGERQGFEPRSQGARVQKALFREPAFLQLSTEILEGCSLRWFAPSEFSPWPARKNVAVIVKVLSQVVGRVWDQHMRLCPGGLVSCCGLRGSPGGRGPVLVGAGAAGAQPLPAQRVWLGREGRWGCSASGSQGRPMSAGETGD